MEQDLKNGTGIAQQQTTEVNNKVEGETDDQVKFIIK